MGDGEDKRRETASIKRRRLAEMEMMDRKGKKIRGDKGRRWIGW